MTDKENLISHILDLKEKSASESILTSSGFLYLEEQSQFIKTEKINNKYVDTFYYGGYDDAERKVVLFVPEFYAVDSDSVDDFLRENDMNPLDVLSVKKDKFSELSHRDYLGALMGLGLKRDVIGDIIINDDGCYIICLKSISRYITENLKQAGRGQLSVTIGDFKLLQSKESKTETVFVSVASLRLDCLVASAFKLSRTNAVNAINQGIVYVNSEQIYKSDYILKSGDKLVLRGKGKVIIDEIIRENKKGRLHLNIKRYL